MASQENIHVSDELLTAVQRLAEEQGKTLDEVFETAAKRYLAHEGLREMERHGPDRARAMDLNVPECGGCHFMQRAPHHNSQAIWERVDVD